MTQRWNVNNGEIPYIPDWNRWDGSEASLEEIIKEIVKEEIADKITISKDEDGNIVITYPKDPDNPDAGENQEIVFSPEDLKGDKGEDGKDGTNGKQGSSWRVSVTELRDNQIDIKTTNLNPPATVIPYQVGDIVLDATNKKLYSITEVDPESGSASLGTSFGNLY